jgi:hypothetical protein
MFRGLTSRGPEFLGGQLIAACVQDCGGVGSKNVAAVGAGQASGGIGVWRGGIAESQTSLSDGTAVLAGQIKGSESYSGADLNRLGFRKKVSAENASS